MAISRIGFESGPLSVQSTDSTGIQKKISELQKAIQKTSEGFTVPQNRNLKKLHRRE